LAPSRETIPFTRADEEVPSVSSADGSSVSAAPAAPAPSAATVDPTERIVIPQDRFQGDAGESGQGEEAALANRRFNFEGFRSRVLGLWFKRKAFVQKNLPDAAAEQTQAMQELCAEVGVTRLDDVAAALVHEGHGFLAEGNFDKAGRSFEDALKFDPDLPDAHFGLATAHWRRSGGFSSAIVELTAGARAIFRNRSTSSAVLGNVLIVLILAVAATAILFSIAMFLRYQVLVRHDLREWLVKDRAKALPREAELLAGWGLLLLPLLTWLFALWTPAYWLTLTFRYQKVREKIITASLLVLMILSAPAARSAEILFGLAADPSARLMLASTSASYDPEQIVNLELKADANPEDPAYRFLLGILYARGRYFQEALEQYRKVIDLDAASYRATNNVGNVYLRIGRPEEALKFYKSALALRQDFLPAYYNSYLARKEMLQLREAEQVLKEGQTVNSAELARIIDEARANGSGEPIEALVTRDEVFHRILGEGSGRTGIASSLISVPSIAAAIFLIAALALVLVFGPRQAMRCVKCGEAFCHACKIGHQVPDYCTQCQQMSLAREALAPALRREKTAQSERFRSVWVRLARIVSVIAPGMGRILDGRTWTGALICAAWSGAILALVLRPHLLQLPTAGTPHPLFLVTLLLGLTVTAVWVLGNVRPTRPSGPAGGWLWH
jgi:tetratricopeptide (TPR) repeat protein